MRPPPPEAAPVLTPPSAWISPAPAIVLASMRMLPPAPELLLASPLARIFPSTCSAAALMRTTPPPERHGMHDVPALDAPAPPGSFGSKSEPNAGGALPLKIPPKPPRLAGEVTLAPVLRGGA